MTRLSEALPWPCTQPQSFLGGMVLSLWPALVPSETWPAGRLRHGQKDYTHFVGFDLTKPSGLTAEAAQLARGSGPATVQARSCRILQPAARLDCLGFERIEGPAALAALPQFPDRRRGLAGEARPSESTRKSDEPYNAEQAQNCGQATCSPQHKPEQRAQNLAAVERIDRQDIEDQQAKVNSQYRFDQSVDVWHQVPPAKRPAQQVDGTQYEQQRHNHQRAGRDTPERCVGPRRRGLCRPRRPAATARFDRPVLPLAAGHRVAELMHGHNHEQGEVFECVPGNRGITAGAPLNLERRHIRS